MKKLSFLCSVMTIGLSAFAGPSGDFVLDSAPTLSVANSNIVTAEQLEKMNLEAVRNYEKHPERWRTNELLTVARGYLSEAKYDQAIPLYRKFLTVQPTNTVAMRELGICYVCTKKYEEAAATFKQGWKLGDDRSLLDLANVYFVQARFSDIKSLVPDLIEARNRMTASDDKHETTNVLIVYSLSGVSPPDKKVFLETMHGLSDEFILERKDTAQAVILGLKTFGYQDRADQLSAKMAK
jgi:tetratricopeptide (TPR) repeat protein